MDAPKLTITEEISAQDQEKSAQDPGNQEDGKETMLFQPRPVGMSFFGQHKRNKSAAELRESFKQSNEKFVRINSEGDFASKSVPNSDSSSNIAQVVTPEKRRLSETRGVNLPKIEMPHKQQKISPLTNALGDPQNPSPLSELLFSGERSAERIRDVVSMRIYVPHLLEEDPEDEENGSGGILFDIEGGREATTEFLLQLMAREYGIEQTTASEAFALWMVSPLLEVQLKPHHRPYEVRKRWMTLLQRFAHESDEATMQADEPAMFFRRNVNLSQDREIAFSTCCTNSLDMLWLDARASLFSGRLLLGLSVAAKLAGIGFAIDIEQYDERKHNIEFIRKNIDSQLPEFLASRVCGKIVFGKALSGTREHEESIISNWKLASREKMRNGGDISDLKRKYLEILRDVPSYGSAFFHASIERPNISPLKEIKEFFRSMTHGSHEIQIVVGVNRNFITLIDEAKHEYLLVHQIASCKWIPMRERISEESDTTDANELILNLAGMENGRIIVNILKIYSNQSPLIEALLSSMQEVHENSEEKHFDVSPAVSTAVTEPVFISRPTNSLSEPNSANSSGSSRRSSSHSSGSQGSLIKENRLCFARFENGKCISANGSLRKINWNDFSVQAY